MGVWFEQRRQVQIDFWFSVRLRPPGWPCRFCCFFFFFFSLHQKRKEKHSAVSILEKTGDDCRQVEIKLYLVVNAVSLWLLFFFLFQILPTIFQLASPCEWNAQYIHHLHLFRRHFFSFYSFWSVNNESLRLETTTKKPTHKTKERRTKPVRNHYCPILSLMFSFKLCITYFKVHTNMKAHHFCCCCFFLLFCFLSCFLLFSFRSRKEIDI